MILNRIRITNTLGVWRIIAGFLAWFLPFLITVPLSTTDGALLVDATLFKSLMIVTRSVTAAAIMIWFFTIVNGSYAREAVITGVCWLVLNRTPDALVLGRMVGLIPAFTRPRQDGAIS